MEKTNIAIIGAGNLGIAIAQGVVKNKLAQAEQVYLTKRSVGSLQRLSNQGYHVTTDNLMAVANSRLILLCVQPKQLKTVLEQINSVLRPDHVLVSTITGVSITEIQSQIDLRVPIIRAMPNTAIAIGESMTCIASADDAQAHLPEVEKLFQALGRTLVIEETLVQAATVLGASGVAFFMRYLRAATQGGIQMGFDSEDAQLIAVQTAKGAASLILAQGSHPEVEIDKVTTPMGCTIEGLNEMEHQGFSSALIKGIMTSYNRITDMKK
jgi:pyrroline-5-carboxylate reductase